jgi:hypothetical protein
MFGEMSIYCGKTSPWGDNKQYELSFENNQLAGLIASHCIIWCHLFLLMQYQTAPGRDTRGQRE